jgi:hypothetical protein
MSRNLGFLMVSMEPPAVLEEEFNDWYDNEHVPERVMIDGFLTARRFVCLTGWPRYLAYYDLRDAGVIAEPGYSAISGKRFSPWSKRILARVRGLWRAHGEQIHPGHLRTTDMARLLFIRFRDIPLAEEGELVARTRELFDARPGVLQARVVRNDSGGTGEYAVLVEASESLMHAFSNENYGDLAARIDVMNEYALYWDRGPVPGVTER